jgi:hypothetical protein
MPYYSLTGVTSPIAITSPTHLWVTGSISNGKPNTLAAEETLILDDGFDVRSSSELTTQAGKR